MEIDAGQSHSRSRREGPGRACDAGAAAEIEHPGNVSRRRTQLTNDRVHEQQVKRTVEQGEGGPLSGAVEGAARQIGSAADVGARKRAQRTGAGG